MRLRVSRLALAAALAAPGSAFAAVRCGDIVTGAHAFVGGIQTCVAPGGTYAPSPTTGALPFADLGYGFIAYGSGRLSSSGAVTINQSNFGAAAVAASQSGVLTLDQGATINLLVPGAYAVQTVNGGTINLGAVGVTTTVTSNLASGVNGLLISTKSSGGETINITNVAASFASSSTGVLADQGGAINYIGGSIAATGAFEVNAAGWNGSTLTLRGTTLTTSGDGGNTLWASNGGTVDGAHLTIRATGGAYTLPGGQGITSGGATNNAFGSTTTGGTLLLANSDIQTTGYGVYTADGGVTTLTDNTVSVSGRFGRTVDTQSGGHTTVLGGSYSTSGFEANNLFASGAGSRIDASSGGTLPLTIGSAGVGTVNAQAFGGATISLNDATLTASGNGAQALWSTNGGVIAGAELTINVTGEVDAATGFHPGGASNNAYAPYSTSAGTLNLTDSAITVSGARGFGVYTAGGGVTTLTGVVISMSGAGSAGVQSDAGGVTLVHGGSVSTTGANSPALLATGAGAQLTAGPNGTSPLSLTTSGDNAHAVQAQGGGAITLGAAGVVTTIDVSGQDARVYDVSGAGSLIDATQVTATLSGDRYGGYGALADQGARLTLNQGSIASTSAFSPVLTAQNGATAVLTGTAITTTGDGGSGLWASQGGTIQGSGVTIRATGGIDEASGLAATGASNNGYNTTTRGGALTLTDSSILATGASAHGVYTADGGVTTLRRVTTRVGGDDAIAVEAGAGGEIGIYGGAVVTTGARAYGLVASAFNAGGSGGSPGRITADLDAGVGLQISTSGQLAHGVMAVGGGGVALTGGSVTVTGDGAIGLLATGLNSVVAANNVVVSASGTTETNAVFAERGGLVAMTGGSASTISPDSYVVAVVSGATARLTNVALTGSGAGSGGVAVNGSASNFSGVGLAVVTRGGADAFSAADGVFNGSFGSYVGGGTVSLTNSTIATEGAFARGVVNADGGALTMTGGSITTSGATAAGVQGRGGGSIELANLSVTTTGAGAKGLDIQGAGVTLERTGISTYGDDAAGLDTANGGSTRFSGGFIATSRVGSIGLLASDAGTSVTVVPDSGGGPTYIATFGARADAVSANAGASISLEGANLATGGDGASGLSVTGPTTTVSATDVTIGTTGGVDTATGLHAHAIYNGPGLTATGGGSLTLTRVIAAAGGDGVDALVTEAGGSTTATSSQFVAVGADAHAVAALGGGSIQLWGSFAATGGIGGIGLLASGAGSRITGDGVAVYTEGGVSGATGFSGFGVYNGPLGGSTAGGAVTLSNSAVTTFGDGAHALVTGAGGGSQVTRSTLETSGAAAYGVDARGGGAVSLNQTSIVTGGAGSHGVHVGAGSSVSLLGANTIAVAGAGASGVYVEAGGAVTGNGLLVVNAAGNAVYLNGSASAALTTMALGSAVALTTTGTAGAAITLSGDNISFTATGGTISAAGRAIALLNGANQSASFANFNIQSLSGDLIFVDPAVSTVSFANTTANAGAGNLANVTNNSQLGLTADNSSLTGVILTAPGSISNVALNNASSWLVTGNSTTTNLNVSNSSIGFSPGAGFTTLTTNNYVGNNALISFNAALGGAGGADQLVINGGTATGSTAVAIRATGTPTGPLRLPLVVTTNGGTIAPDAFALSGPVTSGGYSYALQLQDGGEYLVSTQMLTPQQASGSLASVAQSRQAQAVTARVMSSILTGATEQINCSSCSSGFASFGSFALGVHGRWTLNQNVSLLAGASFDNFHGKGVNVNGALLGALALRYDAVQLGKNRPFAEAGLAAEPWASVTYRRSYLTALGESVGVGTALSRSATLYGRLGYIWRLSRIDEAAAYTSLSRSWTWTNGYSESATPANPFGATFAPMLDRMDIWSVGAQYTHLFGEHIEGNLTAGYARAFGANYGSTAAINGFGLATALAPTGFQWVELGGRVSYRFSRNVVADAFALGTLGAEPAGKQIHGGLALRMAF